MSNNQNSTGFEQLTQEEARKLESLLERKAVTKYTLVPIGAVLAAIAITVGVMQWYNADQQEVVVLRTQLESVQERVNTLEAQAASFNSKVDDQSEALQQISQSLTLIKYRLGIVEGSTNAPTPNNTGELRELYERFRSRDGSTEGDTP